MTFFLKCLPQIPSQAFDCICCHSWIRSKSRVKLVPHNAAATSYCFLSTIWLAHALLCTICQGPLSLQAQHTVKVSQHIIVGTLLCWKQTSLPSVSATWYWLRHHTEKKKSLMHPAYFAMQCIVITVEDVWELWLKTKHLSNGILHRNVVMGFADTKHTVQIIRAHISYIF